MSVFEDYLEPSLLVIIVSLSCDTLNIMFTPEVTGMGMCYFAGAGGNR